VDGAVQKAQDAAQGKIDRFNAAAGEWGVTLDSANEIGGQTEKAQGVQRLLRQGRDARDGLQRLRQRGEDAVQKAEGAQDAATQKLQSAQDAAMQRVQSAQDAAMQRVQGAQDAVQKAQAAPAAATQKGQGKLNELLDSLGGASADSPPSK
jgi:biopolymer transport protein ExbB/TolQ